MTRNTTYPTPCESLFTTKCPKCEELCFDISDGYSSCCGRRLYPDYRYTATAPASVIPSKPTEQ